MKPDHIPSQELTDETLCRLAASGDRVAEERLVMRYNRLVRMCARPYFLAGGDSEDLIQEGMVGLLAAIREYDSSKAAVFRTYAEVCIKNRLFSVIKAAARDKHTPLNNSVSFETPLFSGNGDRFAYHAPGRQVEDPEEIFLSREGDTLYTTFEVYAGPMAELTPAELWAGRQTRGEGSPLRLAYLDRLLRQTERAIAGLKRSKRPEDASRLAELEQVHQGLLDMKEEWLSWQR